MIGLALITCAPAGLDGVPAGDAAVLQARRDGWRILQAWPWPERIRQRPFAGLLVREPLCAGPRPPSPFASLKAYIAATLTRP